MQFLRFSLLGLFLFLSYTFSLGQQALLKKADKLIQAERYAQAIVPLETLLQQDSTTTVASKLTRVYQKINQPQKAIPLYQYLLRQKKINPKHRFQYAEMLMQIGQYDKAVDQLQDYSQEHPDDEKAQQLLIALDKIGAISPLYPNVSCIPFSHNTTADDNSPFFFDQHLFFSSDRTKGLNPLKQKAGWTDRDFTRVYAATKIEKDSFHLPKVMGNKINQLNLNTANAVFWRDTQTQIIYLYFARNSSKSDSQDEFNMQLYMSTSSDDGKQWSKSTLLSFCNNEYNYIHPAISSSGDSLYFVSDKGKGYGGMDIYFATKKTKETWNKPINLGANINTNQHEGFPYLNEKGELFFCSKGHVGYGGFDLFKTTIDNGDWSIPTNLGYPFNSPSDDLSICFDEIGKNGAFTSSRTDGNDDIFLFSLTPTFGETTPNKIENAPSITSNDNINRVDFCYETLALQLDENTISSNQYYSLVELQFEEDKYEIAEKHIPSLDELARLLYAYPNLQIELQSHTITEGSEADLATISRYRVEAIVAYLLKKEIAEIQVQTKALTKEYPIHPCSTECPCTTEEQAKNQRIEMRIVNF